MGYRSEGDACQAKAKSWVHFLDPQKKKEGKKKQSHCFITHCDPSNGISHLSWILSFLLWSKHIKKCCILTTDWGNVNIILAS